MHAFSCTPRFETSLVAELKAAGCADLRCPAPGVVSAGSCARPLDPIFARQQLPEATWIAGASIKALAEAAFSELAPSLDRDASPWLLHAVPAPQPDTAGALGRRREYRLRQAPDADARDRHHRHAALERRAALVGSVFLELLAARRRRSARRRIEAAPPGSGGWRLVQILLTAPNRALASSAEALSVPRDGTDLSPFPLGRAAVAVDRAAPSRAYRKLEEAFAWMGRVPGPGDECLDLGAAPGGWSARLLARGARVTAVDRAPLALPAHPRLETVRADAFRYAPERPMAWLVCDVIAPPERTLALVTRFAVERLARAAVVTFKLKGPDLGVVASLRPRLDALPGSTLRLKHLAANHHEVTLMWTA